jgi:hypothetical protein
MVSCLIAVPSSYPGKRRVLLPISPANPNILWLRSGNPTTDRVRFPLDYEPSVEIPADLERRRTSLERGLTAHLLSGAGLRKFVPARRRIGCAKSDDPIAKEIGTYVDAFRESASLYDLQALSTVSLARTTQQESRVGSAYQKQSKDGTAMLDALTRLANSHYQLLLQARNIGLTSLSAGMLGAIVIVVISII